MTEPEACLVFEALVPSCLFKIARQVSGKFGPVKPIKNLFRSWGRTTKTALRIDYVLIPTQKLLDVGWELGNIGVEVKVGSFGPPYDKKIGRILSQLFDYQSGIFSVDNEPPASLSMVFLFVEPFHRFGQLPASIMMQEGIGLVKGYSHIDGSFKLVHGNGNYPILQITNGIPVYTRPEFGIKAGSR